MKINQVFWCVEKKVFQNGRIEVNSFGREHEEMPRDTFSGTPEKDLSKKWFFSKEEAEAYREKITPSKPLSRSEIAQLNGLVKADIAGLMLGIDGREIYRMANKGIIPSHRIGGKVRFDPADIEDYKLLTKYASSHLHIKPSDANDLFQRLDERHEGLKASLVHLLDKDKPQKRRVAMKS